MSRVGRRAAAKRRLQTLLGITAAVVIALLILLVLQLWDEKTPLPQDGSTDTATTNLTVQSSQTDTDSVTDSSTDTNSVTDTDSTDTIIDTNMTTDTSTDTQTTVRPTDTNTTTDYKTNDPTPGINDDGSFDFSAWNMILVNPDHPIPDDYPLKLARVSLNGKDRQVNSLCADAFKEMVNAAKEDGITLLLRSTYRGIQLQTEGFNAKVQEYINKGYSKEKAKEIAATIVAVPGTSEHHTGLAADITTPSFDRLNQDFDKTDAYQWLVTHCAEYGFILRYPKEKTEITKIIYEPWHYRYVGKEAARIIMSEGICYEEFVEKYGNKNS